MQYSSGQSNNHTRFSGAEPRSSSRRGTVTPRHRGRKIARLTDRVGRTIQAARLVATTTPFLKQSVPGPEYLRPETGPRFAPSPVSRRRDLQIRYAIQRRVCGLLRQSLRHRRFLRLRGGPGRTRTSNQTVLSGRLDTKTVVFARSHYHRVRPFHGVSDLVLSHYCPGFLPGDANASSTSA